MLDKGVPVKYLKTGGVMKTTYLIQTIETTRSILKSNIEGLRDESESLINAYWDEWKERNRIEIKAPHHSSELKHSYLGSYAPKIATIGNGKKITIHWHQFKPFKKNPPNHMSKRVMPLKSGNYAKSCFINHATWEWEMIEKTEIELKPYRDLLEHYHSQYIELGRKLRQLTSK